MDARRAVWREGAVMPDGVPLPCFNPPSMIATIQAMSLDALPERYLQNLFFVTIGAWLFIGYSIYKSVCATKTSLTARRARQGGAGEGAGNSASNHPSLFLCSPYPFHHEAFHE
jgi:hypothetical protein